MQILLNMEELTIGVLKQISEDKVLSITGKIVGGCSLEIYFTQFFWIDKAQSISFPLNLLFLIVTILVSAIILHNISELILKYVKKLKD